jgi:hypothetical protein
LCETTVEVDAQQSDRHFVKHSLQIKPGFLIKSKLALMKKLFFFSKTTVKLPDDGALN